MMHKPVSSLVLGTAQLGLSYGLANRTGRPDLPMVEDIVRTAWEQGVREFDTAQDYGTSESALGYAFNKLGIAAQAMVISKIDPALDHRNPGVMTKALDASLMKLGVPRLFGLMLHNEALLAQWDQGVSSILSGFVRSGKTQCLGVSVYSPEKAWVALNMDGIDMVQLPSNILDNRFVERGVFELAVKKKKQVYIRSVFLQGLILMEPDELPEHMFFARPVVERVKALARELGLTRQALALGYLKARMPKAKLVVGVETPDQLIRNAVSLNVSLTREQVDAIGKYFGRVDVNVLNPALWGRSA